MLTQIKNQLSFLDKLKDGKVIGGIELSSPKPDDAMMNYLKFLFNKLEVNQLKFIHVVPDINFFAFGNTATLELDKNLIEPVQKAIIQTFSGTQVKEAFLEIESGDPLDEILKESKDEEAVMMVIGQKKNGHHNIEARKLARKTNRPVLIIPEKSKEYMNHILVPIDFSDSSMEALQTALAIRKHVNASAKITFIHIYELPDFSTYRISRRPEQIQNQVREDRQIALDQFIENAGLAEDKSIKGVVIEKNNPGIAHYLLDFSKDNDVDFIVMGAKGHTAFENFLLGSVAENLLTQNNEIPTLLVRV